MRNQVCALLVVGNLRFKTCVLCLERGNLLAREEIKDGASVRVACVDDAASVTLVLQLHAINSALGSTAKFVIA